jgi:hypothetical protein
MRRTGSSRSSAVVRRPGTPLMSPSWPRAWLALLGWPAHTPVGHGPTGSHGRPPKPGTGGRGTIRNSREPSQRRVEARYCARLPALLATLPSPDREIVLLRIVAGVSIPNIVTALGVTPAAIHLTQRQALSALQPAAPAPHRPPATRGRVVLLPHARTEPTTPNPPTAVPEGAQA